MSPLVIVQYAGAALLAVLVLYLVVTILILLGRAVSDALDLPPISELFEREVPLVVKFCVFPIALYLEYSLLVLFTPVWIVLAIGVIQVLTCFVWFLVNYAP